MRAATGGSPEIVNLSRHGGDVNAVSSAGQTALHFAARGGFRGRANLLRSARTARARCEGPDRHDRGV
jgi:hypothetical protein